MARHCKICGCDLTTEYKYCESCKKAKKREYSKNRYRTLIANGGKKTSLWHY